MSQDATPEPDTSAETGAETGAGSLGDPAVIEQERSLLGELREIVVQRELELAQLVQDSRRFHTRYVAQVGVHQAELDAIRARIAQLHALAAPEDEELDHAAVEAARLAAEAARAARDAQRDLDRDDEDDQDDELDEDERHRRALIKHGKLKRLRAMFRELARRVHPDLALDEETRKVRTEVMADVLEAYEAGDERRLRMMAEAYVELDGQGEPIGELAPIRQMIVRMRLRLEALDQQIAEHKAGFLYHLALRAQLVAAEGGDLLVDLAAAMQSDVEQARDELVALEKRLEATDDAGEAA